MLDFPYIFYLWQNNIYINIYIFIIFRNTIYTEI